MSTVEKRSSVTVSCLPSPRPSRHVRGARQLAYCAEVNSCSPPTVKHTVQSRHILAACSRWTLHHAGDPSLDRNCNLFGRCIGQKRMDDAGRSDVDSRMRRQSRCYISDLSAFHPVGGVAAGLGRPALSVLGSMEVVEPSSGSEPHTTAGTTLVCQSCRTNVAPRSYTDALAHRL
jgi:hypothetical protein